MQDTPTIRSASGLRLWQRRIKAIFRPIDFAMDREREYGDFYQVKFVNAPPTVMTSNPQAIEEILTLDSDGFEVGRGNKMLSFLVGNNSLLLLDGKKHQNRRRLLMPPFHGESLQKCSNSIVEITQKLIQDWQPGATFAVRSLTQEITLKVILSVVFGVDSGEKGDRLQKLLTSLLDIFNTPLTSSFMFFPALQKDWGKFSPWGRFLRLKEEIRTLVYAEIAERRNLIASGNSDNYSILTLLLQAKDENGEKMSDEELHDELITLLFAGHETTASALAWLFYWIHYLPEVQTKLREELNSISKLADYKIINSLPYLDAVISETLRIYPIAMGTFGRVLTKPGSVMNWEFETGTWFIASIYGLHRREDLYPDAERFAPERFLLRKYSPYEYLPFGGGNRRCIGSALALLEMKLITATVLSQFELALMSKKPMYPVRRGLTLAPPSSFKMKVIEKL